MYSIDIPHDIGINLNNYKIILENSKIDGHLPKKTIIRVFGTICAGKGTISKSLSAYYKIPNVDTGKIWRAVTFICISQGLEANYKNVVAAFDSLSIEISDHNISLIYQEKELQNSQLKNPEIDSVISKYAVFRDAYNNFLIKLFKNTNYSMVLDGRGSLTPYLIEAEKLDYKVIRIFLYATLEEATNRRSVDYKNNNSANLDLNQIKELIIKRDTADFQTLIDQNLGFITPETAMLDTSDIEIEDAFEICKDYINKLTKN